MPGQQATWKALHTALFLSAPLLALLLAAAAPPAHAETHSCPSLALAGQPAYVASPPDTRVEAYALPSMAKVEAAEQRLYSIGEAELAITVFTAPRNADALLIVFYGGREASYCIVRIVDLDALIKSTLAATLRGELKAQTEELHRIMSAEHARTREEVRAEIRRGTEAVNKWTTGEVAKLTMHIDRRINEVNTLLREVEEKTRSAAETIKDAATRIENTVSTLATAQPHAPLAIASYALLAATALAMLTSTTSLTRAEKIALTALLAATLALTLAMLVGPAQPHPPLPTP